MGRCRRVILRAGAGREIILYKIGEVGLSWMAKGDTQRLSEERMTKRRMDEFGSPEEYYQAILQREIELFGCVVVSTQDDSRVGDQITPIEASGSVRLEHPFTIVGRATQVEASEHASAIAAEFEGVRAAGHGNSGNLWKCITD